METLIKNMYEQNNVRISNSLLMQMTKTLMMNT
jgi:hypothetical protein